MHNLGHVEINPQRIGEVVIDEQVVAGSTMQVVIAQATRHQIVTIGAIVAEIITVAGATFVAAGHDIVAAATGDQIVAGYFKVDQDQQRVARCHVYRIDASRNNEICLRIALAISGSPANRSSVSAVT